MAPHSSTLAWKIPWTEEPGRLQSMGSLESDTTKRLHFHFSLSCIGEGNGNPLQCCLENPRDRKPGGGPSIGSHGVGHNWSDAAAAAAVNQTSIGGNLRVWSMVAFHWPPTPILLPGKSHGRRSLVGWSPCDCTESDTTEWLSSSSSSFSLGFPGCASGKEHTCYCKRPKRHGLDPLVRKIPWRRKCQAIPVFLLG